MELPRDLRPWAEQLAIFPRDVALSLGGLVRRLSVVISPLRISHLHGEEQPDGISGLQTQPAYERLLPSEWLMAEEIPEEFDRRAVMGEQLFFRRHTRHSSYSAVSVALFDCGPCQLGSPRIVQMALLILMQRRAQAAHADFYWGILQDSDSLHTHLSVNSIRAYLQGRSALSVNNEMCAAWQEKLLDFNQLNELWIISDHKPILEPYKPRYIQVSDQYQRNDTTLKVTVHSAKQTSVIQLPLPHDDLCTRLLRDPFQSAQPQRHLIRSAVTAQSPLLFSHAGRKLMIALDNGDLMQHPLANSPRAKPGYPRTHSLPDGHLLVAAQMIKKNCLLITLKDHTLHFHNIPGMGSARTLSLVDYPDITLAANIAKLKPLHFSYEPGYTHCVFLLDDAQQLIRFTWNPHEVSAGILNHNVVAVTMARKRLDYLRLDDETSATVVMGSNSYHPEQRTIKLSKPATGKAFLSATSNMQYSVEVAALELQGSQWKIADANQHSLVTAYPNTEVIGAFAPLAGVHHQDFVSRLALVLIEQDRSCISIINKDQQFSTPKETSKIVYAVYDANYGQLAYVLKNKTVKVYSLIHRQFVLNLQTSHDDKNA